ncbi:MAG TPA: glycoside hydrolase family 2 TIM barrel-domain containing protein [Bacteroidales bacterium]|nr:glycoside hydrolase family 2 TIM barrel-domain containing protein [Bacteroidales bacterium]
MKSKYFLAGLLATLLCTPLHAKQNSNIETNWRFNLGEAVGAEKPDFNDENWRILNLPHDWSIEGEYSSTNPTGRGGGYLPAGIGWYRKTLAFPSSESDKRIFITFDGVMSNSQVWINGQLLGKRPYGYVPFTYELTGKVNFDKPNILAVRADNTLQPASRWYAGAGIYRHVRLECLNPIHLEQWGVYITTPQVSKEKATIQIQASVFNQSKKVGKITVQTLVSGSDGKKILSAETTLSVPAGQKTECKQLVNITKPMIWDIETPNLYQAVTTIRSGKTVLDEQTNTFGIRDFKFEAATGFWLNGKNFKLYGVCLHQDAGPLGVAIPSSVWITRLEKLKEIGVNAIRTAHNPMEPAFYDLCDQLGFLVMDETFDTWTAAKPSGTQGYNLYFNEWWEADTRAMVIRDRNHPSIILYSVGNEIRDRLNSDEGRQRFLNQRDLIHQLDPTRPVTMALFRPNEMQVYTNGFADLLDVLGQNYRENELIAAHNDKPERKVVGTENGHDRNTWLALRDNPFMSGQFLWTGIDYLGEANWPDISRHTGLLGRNGDMNPAGYQRQSWWSNKPMVKMVRAEDNMGKGSLVMDWTPADFGTYDEAYVTVYSNCDEVELFLNNESKGRQSIHADASPRFWNVGFNPGVLKAVGYNKGQEVASDQLKTAEAATKVSLTCNRNSIKNNWNDIVYVKATLMDANGERNPNVNPKLTFTLSGPGIIKAVDNGDISSHEKYATNVRTAFRGEGVALVQATGTGKITLIVSAEGFEGSTLTLEAK